MSLYRQLDVFDDLSSYLFGFHSFPEEPAHLFHDCNHDYHFNAYSHSPPFEVFDDFSDLNHFERAPCSSCYRRTRLRHRPDHPCVWSLHEEISRLESEFHRILGATKVMDAERKYTWKAKIKSPDYKGQDRKYQWMAKIKPRNDRKYKWKALIKGGKEEAPACKDWHIDRRCTRMADVENGVDRKYGWKAKIKPGDAPKYEWTAEVYNGLDNKCKWKGQIKGGKHSHAGVCIPCACNVEKKKGSCSVRVVEMIILSINGQHFEDRLYTRELRLWPWKRERRRN